MTRHQSDDGVGRVEDHLMEVHLMLSVDKFCRILILSHTLFIWTMHYPINACQPTKGVAS